MHDRRDSSARILCLVTTTDPKARERLVSRLSADGSLSESGASARNAYSSMQAMIKPKDPILMNPYNSHD